MRPFFKLVSVVLVCLLFHFSAEAQVTASGTYLEVHTILKNNCAFSSCHSATKKEAGLNFEDTPENVYQSLIGKDPQNAKAKSKNQKLVYAGDPYRSFLFRKINGGLDLNSKLTSGEGSTMPTIGSITNKDKELIRQWIHYGAKDTGIVYSGKPGHEIPVADLIKDYYDNGGINTVETPLAPPAAADGFQVHYGPFFLAPNTEIEYFWKYPLGNANSLEITRFLYEWGQSYTHHFICYQNIAPDATSEGIRIDNAAHSHDLFLTTAGSKYKDFKLPQNTAYHISSDYVFDMNSHYINNSNKVLAAHVYMNIYTQPAGTSELEMKSQYLNDYQILLPPQSPVMTLTNSDKTVTQTGNQEDLYIWMIANHTHRLGKGSRMWVRNSDNSKGVQIYNAENKDGNPDSAYIGYSYESPELRFFPAPFFHIKNNEGIIFETDYQNFTNDTIRFGLTSLDEMNAVIFQYTSQPLTSSTTETFDNQLKLTVYPNPANAEATVKVAGPNTSYKNITLEARDLLGKVVGVYGNGARSDEQYNLSIPTNDWPSGVYVFTVKGDGLPIGAGKIVVKH